jgi:hypothetical protein
MAIAGSNSFRVKYSFSSKTLLGPKAHKNLKLPYIVSLFPLTHKSNFSTLLLRKRKAISTDVASSEILHLQFNTSNSPFWPKPESRWAPDEESSPA